MHIHSDALPGKRAGMAALILLCACFSAADAPSRFDYYVLSLSWSPQYCARALGHEPQCARPNAFVVHGLWPQYERGYPSDCRTNARVAEATIERMLPIMPSRRLVIHEWRAHGSCSGSSPHAYFADVERDYRSSRVSDTRWTQARACSTDMRDRCGAVVVFRPVR